MPRTDGFAVVRSVGEECMPPVIFVTAHDQYAIQASIDYLLKPVAEERFAVAFKQALGATKRAARSGRTTSDRDARCHGESAAAA
jgi:two-component system, LytTR family, response regulator